jgi:hypothetical protein
MKRNKTTDKQCEPIIVDQITDTQIESFHILPAYKLAMQPIARNAPLEVR